MRIWSISLIYSDENGVYILVEVSIWICLFNDHPVAFATMTSINIEDTSINIMYGTTWCSAEDYKGSQGLKKVL